jgi:Mlc titration factor MtfA (ptsG expression regulator)
MRLLGPKARRRKRLREVPFPPEWRAVVERNVPYYGCLPDAQRRELEGLIQIFVAEKSFEGAGGLTMTDEIRVTIAAQACMLLLGRETDIYPGLQAIIVYPHAYIAHAVRRQNDGTVFEGRQVRLGESWMQGALVLSWDDVVRGAADFHDGHNVVFHEFAHQLDAESGGTEGAPVLANRSMYVAWARVLGAEYESLVESVRRHRPSFLDQYGATNPAEFFAVATEFFFEKSAALRRLHPELYEQLRLFYRQDPAEWRSCP